MTFASSSESIESTAAEVEFSFLLLLLWSEGGGLSMEERERLRGDDIGTGEVLEWWNEIRSGWDGLRLPSKPLVVSYLGSE